MRLGLELPGEPAVPAMADFARQAEALGYESIWLTETRFTRDAVSTSAAVAAATRSARVATAVINPYTRGAVLTAVTAATLDELCGGRFILGIGAGSPTVLARQGIPFDRPLTRLRETVEVVRRLLRGERVEFSGETLTVDGVQLDFVPIRSEIPIYLGVTGPKALALAGAIGDGVLLNGFVSVSYLERAVQIIREAATRAGRDPDAIDIAASTVVSIDRDGQEARDAARQIVAIYLAEFPNVAREARLPGEFLEGIAAAHRAGGVSASAPLVSDAIVDRLTCVGTANDVLDALRKRREVGVQLPVISFVSAGMSSTLADLIA